jgi:pyridoxal phosphate enzyme (YggS family)
MTAHDVGAAWLRVQGEVEAAARAAGRPAQSVRLIAVSKKHPAQAVAQAFEAGARDFGENYVQELVQKRAEFEAIYGTRAREARWHLIGPLQRNKVKHLGRLASIQTVDRGELLEELDRRGAEVEALLVQVHIGDEASKGGVAVGELGGFLGRWASFGRIPLRGLMCIPPPRERPEHSAQDFAQLRGLLEEARAGLGEAGAGLTELSMGMSDDFEVAIAQGATMVRVGTAIFGART